MFKPIQALALAGAMTALAGMAAAEPTTTPGALIDTPVGKLWVETCGSGPKTLVMLHDGVIHSAGFDDVWPTLCKHFRVIRYDRPGYGRSPGAKAAYAEVDDVQAVMQAEGVSRAAILGASHGGGIAIDFTLAHPEAVERLVVVGPEVSGIPYSKHFQAAVAGIGQKLARGDVVGAIKASWFFAPGDDADAERTAKLLTANRQNLMHRDRAIPPPPAAPRLSSIKVPTLVLVGEADIADNQAQAGVVEYAVPGARRVVIPKAGHAPYMAQPTAFTDLVVPFVEGAP